MVQIVLVIVDLIAVVIKNQLKNAQVTALMNLVYAILNYLVILTVKGIVQHLDVIVIVPYSVQVIVNLLNSVVVIMMHVSGTASVQEIIIVMMNVSVIYSILVFVKMMIVLMTVPVIVIRIIIFPVLVIHIKEIV